MNDYYCHIVGLNLNLKDKLTKILNKNEFKFDIIDLDKLTNKIINDKNMGLMYDKYEEFLNKSKENKNFNKKSKDIEKQMIEYWKNKMDILLKRESKRCKNKIILIGSITHFKLPRYYVKIDCYLRFFLKVSLKDNAKKVIANNLDIHRNEIIEGSFPLEYLNIDYLIKKRENSMNIYKKIGYEIKSLSSILKLIFTNKDFNLDNIGYLYVASRDKQVKKIKCDNNKRVISYTIPWLALLSNFDCTNIQKKLSSNNSYIKQTKKGSFNKLKKECYLYQVEKNDFYHHENGKGIKFVSIKPAKILENYYISNVYDYLIENGISLIK